MKKRLALVLMCAMTITVSAQAWIPKQNALDNTQNEKRSIVNFESRHGEAFTVFIDGDPANRMPQGRVTVNNVSRQPHEVVVVLRRPAEKAAVLNMVPGEDNVIVNVDYDINNGYLHLYTAPCNRQHITPPTEISSIKPRPVNPAVPIPVFDGNDVTLVVEGMSTKIATDTLVNDIINQLKSTSFDSDRLPLARTLLSSMLFTSEQIARIAQSLDFSNSQVEFLKYAYRFCCDPRNYGRALEVLTFSSDRKKVSDYIASQN